MIVDTDPLGTITFHLTRNNSEASRIPFNNINEKKNDEAEEVDD